MHKGLILCTGPTGSGKSTSLAAFINYILETQRKHIITIEDPIEYEFSHTSKSIIHQREVSRDTSSFASALKASLREDPDVIYIGEMRDLETIQLAITAAETGHLVLGTLHTSSASKTVTGASLMHLYQQNLFLLNDNINDYLPFDVNHPNYPEVPITFKMLFKRYQTRLLNIMLLLL